MIEKRLNNLVLFLAKNAPPTIFFYFRDWVINFDYLLRIDLLT